MKDFKAASKTVLRQMGDAAGSQRLRDAIEFWEHTMPNASIEEYYVLADLLQRLEPNTSGETSDGARRVENVRYLIAKTLEVSMGTDISITHRRFFHLMMSKPTSGDVISLNWDIAYDRIVAFDYGPSCIDYGYSKAKPFSPDPAQYVEHPSFRVLKLHGSTNWWFCGNCQTLWYDAQSKTIVHFWEGPIRRCATKDCGRSLAPFMVPPTSQKFESSQFVTPLSEIWNGARDLLSNCSEVVFVGYSFPQTDIQFKVFVAEALSRNSNLETIGVVTSPKFGSSRNAFEDNYSGVLSGLPIRHELRFRYFTFEQWVEEGGSLYDPARLV